ncbi:ATP-binding protein [Candidatus Parcubacteria bacterium]|nr:ATP-binding protein [Candidatus Parcubacteria bacterium]
MKRYKNKNSEYNIPESGNYLANLKKINIFVGANNSGKSRFMRAIFQSGVDDFVFFENFNDKLKKIFKELEPHFGKLYYMQDLKDLTSSEAGDYAKRYDEFYDKIEQKQVQSSGTGNVSDLQVALSIKQKMQEEGIYKKFENRINISNKHIYIPMLRGLRQIDIEKNGDDHRDYYKEKTEKDYNLSSEDDNYSIFSGLSVYVQIKRMLLGSRKDRQLIAQFESFLSENFFKNKPITLVSDYDSDNIKINIGNS